METAQILALSLCGVVLLGGCSNGPSASISGASRDQGHADEFVSECLISFGELGANWDIDFGDCVGCMVTDKELALDNDFSTSAKVYFGANFDGWVHINVSTPETVGALYGASPDESLPYFAGAELYFERFTPSAQMDITFEFYSGDKWVARHFRGLKSTTGELPVLGDFPYPRISAFMHSGGYPVLADFDAMNMDFYAEPGAVHYMEIYEFCADTNGTRN